MELEIKAKKTAVYNKEISEIDFILQDELSTKEEKDKYEDINVDITEVESKIDADTDSYPLNIAILEKMLNEAKAKGATHVEIDYHCDHIGYIVSGFKIERQ